MFLAQKGFNKKMALTINTNISSIIAQRNLNKATTALNNAIERMTTGYKINSSADNAAGYSIANLWQTQISSLDVAADNAATGSDMLTTLEDTYSLISSHLQRIRDLTEQAANGTYGLDSLTAIQSEITARLNEITRISESAEFNGLKIMGGTMTGVSLQVGLYGDANSKITLEDALFQKADTVTLFTTYGKMTGATVAKVAAACAGLNDDGSSIVGKQNEQLPKIDDVIKEISSRATKIGAARNRIDSAIESIGVQSQNLTSSLSTLRDADIADESSKYIQAQILQQASATLLSTANQLPSIALNLI